MKEYLELFKKKKLFIFFIAISFTFIISFYNLLQTMEYEAKVGLLITPKSTIGVDTYSSIKSAERIANNLKFLIYTSSFFNKLKTDKKINFNYFQKNPSDWKKQWTKMIETKVIYNTGYLYISVFHENADQACEIANQIANVLINNSNDYLNQDIFVKIEKIDDCIVSKNPVRPHFFRDALLAFILGILTALSYLILKKDLLAEL